MRPVDQNPIQVIIAYQHEGIRRELATFLDLHRGIKVVATASTGEEAVNLCKNMETDFLIIDFAIAGMNSFQVARLLKELHPAIRTIILSNFGDEDQRLNALQVGAYEYLQKENTARLLAVLQGGEIT